MKKTILLIAFAATVTLGVAQNDKKETKDSDRSAGLKKIASGKGEERIQEEVDRAMRDVKVDLEDLDIDIRLDGLKVLDNLDEIIEASLSGLDEQLERSLEGLDEQIERTVENSLRNLDKDLERSLRHLEDLDIDIDRDIDVDVDIDHDTYRNDNRNSNDRKGGVRINGMTVEEYQKQQDAKEKKESNQETGKKPKKKE